MPASVTSKRSVLAPLSETRKWEGFPRHWASSLAAQLNAATGLEDAIEIVGPAGVPDGIVVP